MDTELEQAARLLLEIAGPADEHIEMSRTGPAKYYTVARPITLDDCMKHLRGVKTRGAQLRHPESMARALAFDADSHRIYPGWWWMCGAAQLLTNAGYQILLEPSPAGRSGHLWIIFDGLVDARAARRHVCELAPVLADVREYWPGPAQALKWNKVRLPGGRYISPEMSAWCKLYDTQGQLLASNGLAAARVLLHHQTLASIVPSLDADDQEQEMPPDAAQHSTRAERSFSQTRMPQRSAPGRQQQKYGEASRFLWFHYSPAQVAAWYNARSGALGRLWGRSEDGRWETRRRRRTGAAGENIWAKQGGGSARVGARDGGPGPRRTGECRVASGGSLGLGAGNHE